MIGFLTLLEKEFLRFWKVAFQTVAAPVLTALLYLLMWTVVLPPENNPVLDDHILGMISMIVLGLTLAGDTWGLGSQWAKTHLVRQNPWLR